MHEQHLYKESDEQFVEGTLAHLVIGNEGRVLDGRRTPGFIESYDEPSAMFIWRITAFEDKGKCWEIPAEEVSNYQFRRNCKTLSDEQVKRIASRCDELKRIICITQDAEAKKQTKNCIDEKEKEALNWCKENSRFARSGKKLPLNSEIGDFDLCRDLEDYLSFCGVIDLERLTAEQYVLNPYSGEWIKGIKIVMAEMGLMDYCGREMRKPDAFINRGTKQLRRKYIIARIAFVRAIFRLAGFSEVQLYRGMSSNISFFETPRTLLSTTFSLKTALSFADFESDARNAYCVKYTCPIEALFMTYLETKELNERYKEQEAIIIYDKTIKF